MRIHLLLALLLSAGNVEAQTEPAPRVRLTAAAEVRSDTAYALPPKGRLVGVLVAEDEDSLTVKPEGRAESVRISRASLQGLEVSRGRKSRMTGALIGLGVGLGAGAAMHLACKDDPRAFFQICGDVALAVGVGVGVPAALIGLAVSPSDHWERRPVRPDGRGAHFKLKPERRGVGAALTIGF